MRIAFVTAEGDQILYEDVDRPCHEASFVERGVELDYRFWTDPDVDWRAYDLVVIRSTWDYATKRDQFIDWLDSVAHLPTLENPAELIRWNLDKNYLLELGECGVAIVETTISGDLATIREAIYGCSASEVVVKPAVSAGSRLTGWFERTDPAAVDLAEGILAEGGTVMVEPFVTSVASVGEVSLVYFDGVLSHSLRKGPLLERGGGLLGGEYTEVITAHEPTQAELELGEQARLAVEAIARRNGRLAEGKSLLYARYDIVELDDGSPALIEAELFEPSLFVEVSTGAADRFTDVCVARAQSRMT